MSDNDTSESSSELDGSVWKRGRSWGSSQSDFTEAGADLEVDIKEEEEDDKFGEEHNEALFQWAQREEDKRWIQEMEAYEREFDYKPLAHEGGLRPGLEDRRILRGRPTPNLLL